jgi:Protein of unknown function (DUF998)
MYRHPASRSTLGRAAFAGIAVFVAIVCVLHVVQSGTYHPLSEAVSELALGRAGWLMAIAFCSIGTGTLFLAAVLTRLSSRPRVAAWLIGLSGALSYVSAFVHADGPGRSTTHGTIHQMVGVTTFILLVSGMFALVRPLRRDPEWQALATPTLVLAIAAVAAFFMIPISGTAYFGVAQRIFLSLVVGWALTMSWHAWRLPATQDNVEHSDPLAVPAAQQ